MIESIQLSKGVLRLSVTCARRPAPGQRKRCIEFDLGEGGAVSELHRGQFMDLLESVHAERADKISNAIFELLCADPRVRWINLNLIYRSNE